MTAGEYICAACGRERATTLRTEPAVFTQLVSQKETILTSKQDISVPLCREDNQRVADLIADYTGNGVLNDRPLAGAHLDNFVLDLSPQEVVRASSHGSGLHE